MRIAVFSALLVSSLLLPACGGGGGEASSSAAPPASPLLPPVDSNSIAAQFDSGVFFFDGAGSTVNDVDQAYIRKVTHGVTDSTGTTLVATRFAGADSTFSNTLFDALPVIGLEPTGNDWSLGRSAYPRLSYGDNNTALISWGWGLELTMSILEGTPISDYLAQARSGTNAPVVTGNFGQGARAVALTYRALADKIFQFGSFPRYLRDRDFNDVTDLAGLATSSTCFTNPITNKALAILYRDNGSADLYDTSANTPNQCGGTLPPSFGQATYTQKIFGNHGYLDFVFPTDFDMSQYSNAFTPQEFAAGARFVIAQPAADNGWSVAFFVPNNGTLSDPVLHMNQKAAEDLKAVLTLP